MCDLTSACPLRPELLVPQASHAEPERSAPAQANGTHPAPGVNAAVLQAAEQVRLHT